MKEAIDEVLAAEKRAEELLAEAHRKAEEIRRAAEAAAADAARQARERAAAASRAALERAEQEALERYRLRVAEVEAEGRAPLAADAMERLVDGLVELLAAARHRDRPPGFG